VHIHDAKLTGRRLSMDHHRTISLQCPSCGGIDFESRGSDDPSAIVERTTCHRMGSREQLINDNAEHIEIHKQERAQQAIADFKKGFEKKLRDAFRGNKFVKLK
jgi:hypothetical protein